MRRQSSRILTSAKCIHSTTAIPAPRLPSDCCFNTINIIYIPPLFDRPPFISPASDNPDRFRLTPSDQERILSEAIGVPVSSGVPVPQGILGSQVEALVPQSPLVASKSLLATALQKELNNNIIDGDRDFIDFLSPDSRSCFPIDNALLDALSKPFFGSWWSPEAILLLFY
jgi:hypothetical protein